MLRALTTIGTLAATMAAPTTTHNLNIKADDASKFSEYQGKDLTINILTENWWMIDVKTGLIQETWNKNVSFFADKQNDWFVLTAVPDGADALKTAPQTQTIKDTVAEFQQNHFGTYEAQLDKIIKGLGMYELSSGILTEEGYNEFISNFYQEYFNLKAGNITDFKGITKDTLVAILDDLKHLPSTELEASIGGDPMVLLNNILTKFKHANYNVGFTTALEAVLTTVSASQVNTN